MENRSILHFRFQAGFMATIHLVTSTDSPEFTLLSSSLIRSSVVGLDAEWKPIRSHQHQPTFPTVSLVQIACLFAPEHDSTDRKSEDSLVFLLDLQEIHLPSMYELLREAFVDPKIIKLGFRLKQDLVYLSSTFCSQGCNPGFDMVEPFIDITCIYNYLVPPKQLGRKVPKQTKSLAAICKEVLGISLSKELQCSDWSQRPLTEEQKKYAAADAHCLIDIFKVFQAKVVSEGNLNRNLNKKLSRNFDLGLKQIFEKSSNCNLVTRSISSEASDVIRATIPELHSIIQTNAEIDSTKSCEITKQLDDALLWIVSKYGDRILLKDSDRKPKTSKKKVKKFSAELLNKQKRVEIVDDWQGPPPWDLSSGGDGCPKFLCDVMVEGLAKHLRCVGIDAAVPHSKKPETRELIEQADKENRVLLTRDAKLLRLDYLTKNQIYRVKSLLKNEQLLEIIETFQLKISEDRLMSRCTKCNGRFIQKPLTTEEAVEAAKGFQVIPNCLFNKNIEFWQCMDCNQLYWEGTQYHNAVQKFISVCKLHEEVQGHGI